MNVLSSTTMSIWSWPATLLATPSAPFLSLFPHHNKLCKNHPSLPITTTTNSTNISPLIITHCSNSTVSTTLSWSETDQESEYEEEYTEDEEEEQEDDEKRGSSSQAAALRMGHVPPLMRRRRRYRKKYPGEKKGITEEMRFVAMKLRNTGKPKKAKNKNMANKIDDDGKELSASDGEGEVTVALDEENGGDGADEQNGETWDPSMEGFLKYLVDSKLVFTTVERIVDESSDVSYAYFRKTGLERAECLFKDLEWFSQQGNSIPEPSNPGVTYAKYLEELAEKSPPLFMSHFYNIYFSHIAGGQVIARKVSKKLLDSRELEFFKWEGNEEELLRGARQKLNMLGEHWSRDEKNKCLREATKAFRFLGQIVRLIVL